MESIVSKEETENALSEAPVLAKMLPESSKQEKMKQKIQTKSY